MSVSLRCSNMLAFFLLLLAISSCFAQFNAASPNEDNPAAQGASMKSKKLIYSSLIDETSAGNASEIYMTLLKKKPYSKLWTVEQKWDDIFKRFIAVQNSVKSAMMKNFFRDIEYYADISISPKCAEDLKYLQNYAKKSKNFKFLAHMIDSFGKAEPGMLTGNLAELGHVVQCVRVRAPARPSNDTFDERFFEAQTELLGERFRGKYCLASVRPVLPEKPRLVSRFKRPLNEDLLSNISYMGEPSELLKQRSLQTFVPKSVIDSIDRTHNRIDQVPFESELYQYLIAQRSFMYSLPRFIGVCYPSSCSQDDIRYSMQKTFDDQHQVVDLEFDCEIDEHSAWDWYNTSRLVAHVFLFLVVAVITSVSLARHILVDRLQLKKRKNLDFRIVNLIRTLDSLSLDKCVGMLFIKTKPASPITDTSKLENNRSASIDALKGLLTLILIYCQLVQLGCLPVPFMWSKWSDAMFPFYRAWFTQIFLNTPIWTESFYIISAYLIGLKLLENHRPKSGDAKANRRLPDLATFALNRYIRLLLPMVGFIVLNYVWPRLSNGFVMQDQTNKMLTPCDNHGWTNLLMFHNYNHLNETCLWPSHVSASFFQLHLLSYPIFMLLLVSLRFDHFDANKTRSLKKIFTASSAIGLMLILAIFGIVYPAYVASSQELIVPFLIDYLDIDNYQRVIEWIVLPTYNHLTSYMTGIALAYLVVKKRANRDARKLSQTDSVGLCSNMDHESSLESINYFTTQKPDSQTPASYKGAVDMLKLDQSPRDIYGMHMFNQQAPSAKTTRKSYNLASITGGLVSDLVFGSLVIISLTASWFWTGLGQPMTSQQTFWYLCATKITFCLSFAILFYKHFATRRNSVDSWMLTRFLVPIGRMSLTVFYMSWLVTWFDLLTSLYQWHPSHYFVFEKFNEIIFMTLVFSLFAYGAFEGTVKMAQYLAKKEAFKQKLAGGIAPTDLQGFDYLFTPSHNQFQRLEIDLKRNNLANNYQEQSASTVERGDNATAVNKSSTTTSRQLVNPNPSSTKTTATTTTATITSHHFNNNRSNKSYVVTSPLHGAQPTTSHGGNTGRHLSIADQYKLNAELRANYSFASIGLYESAGAIGDLPSPSDLQVSPEPAARHRH